MNDTHNAIPLQFRREAINALNQSVVEMFDLFACVKQAHWSTRGKSDVKLDEMAGHIMSHIYHAVERATMLGALADDTFRESVKLSRLSREKETPQALDGINDWMQELARLHSLAGGQINQAMKQLAELHDFGSADLLADISRTLDTHLWLLEAHINHR